MQRHRAFLFSDRCDCFIGQKVETEALITLKLLLVPMRMPTRPNPRIETTALVTFIKKDARFLIEPP
jgi:hypothetical protein